jgi:hypothetical protein
MQYAELSFIAASLSLCAALAVGRAVRSAGITPLYCMYVEPPAPHPTAKNVSRRDHGSAFVDVLIASGPAMRCGISSEGQS